MPTDPCENCSWYDAVRETLFGSGKPISLPPGCDDSCDWWQVIQDIQILQKFSAALSHGDLSANLKLKGQLAGSLKNLQASLRHLTWQAQQISSGDLGQKVSFLGDFSTAFNSMTEKLKLSRQELLDKEARFRLLAENSHDVIWTMDLQWRFTYVSPSVMALRGYSPEEVLAQSIEDALTPDSARIVREGLNDFLQRNQKGIPVEVGRFELEQPCKDGSTVWTEVVVDGIRDTDGNINGILGVSRDISLRHQVQMIEKEEHTLVSALADTARALNSALKLDEIFHIFIKNIARVVPYDALEIMLIDNEVGRIVEVEGFENLPPEFPAALKSTRFPVREFANLKWIVETHQTCIIPDTTLFQWVNLTSIEWIRSYLGAPILVDNNVVGVISLISAHPNAFSFDQVDKLETFSNQVAVAIERALLFDRLKFQATHDPLTKLTNRGYFFELARKEFQRSLRYHSKLALLMVDIDHFKIVNDSYGHAVGDQVLEQVATFFTNHLRMTDLVSRLGGEEFVILLSEANMKKGIEVANRLCQNFASHKFETSAGLLSLTVSIGVSSMMKGINNIQGLIDCADQAMYAAKKSGRNQVAAYKTHPRHKFDNDTFVQKGG